MSVGGGVAKAPPSPYPCTVPEPEDKTGRQLCYKKQVWLCVLSRNDQMSLNTATKTKGSPFGKPFGKYPAINEIF